MTGSLPVRVRTQTSGESREEDVLRGYEDGTHVTSASATTGEAPRPAARPRSREPGGPARRLVALGRPALAHMPPRSRIFPLTRSQGRRFSGGPGEHPHTGQQRDPHTRCVPRTTRTGPSCSCRHRASSLPSQACAAARGTWSSRLQSPPRCCRVCCSPRHSPPPLSPPRGGHQASRATCLRSCRPARRQRS